VGASTLLSFSLVFSSCWVIRSLKIFLILVVVYMIYIYILQLFLHLSPFYSLNRAEYTNFVLVQFINYFSWILFCMYYNKLVPSTMSQDFLLHFCSIGFICSSIITFRFMITFELFWYMVKGVHSSWFIVWISSCFSTIC
jgi:hypothetical protein